MSSLIHEFTPDESETAGLESLANASWLDRYTVGQKLKGVVLLSTLVLVVVGSIILGGMAYFNADGATQKAYSISEVRLNNATIRVGEANSAIHRYLKDEASDDEIAAAAAKLDDAEAALVEAIEVGTGALPDEFTASMQGFESRLDTLRADLQRAGLEQSNLIEIERRSGELAEEMSGFTFDFSKVSFARADNLFALINTFLIVVSILFIAAALLAFFCSRLMVANIAGMIQKMTSSMELIASGRTGGEIPGRERQDEIGAMARSLAVFREDSLKLRDLNATRAREAEEQLAQQQALGEETRALRREKSQLLANLADGFEVSVGDLITSVSAASEQLQSTSRHMVNLAEGAKGQAGEATNAMGAASANVTAAAAATDEFALSISEISRQASSSAELARGTSTLVTSANTRMGELEKAAAQVGEIIELIQTIAQRTNLLALNASIEAARGGEAGRGFAVVASEVKELAMQTSNAANSVTEQITAMQSSTKSSAQDLGSIVSSIGELEQAAVMIASAVDQQAVSGDELARNIDTAASGSAKVAEQLKALRKSSEETGSAADEVVSSAGTLSSHVEDLRSKSTRFIEDVRRSAREFELSEVEPVAAPVRFSRAKRP